MKSLRLVVPAGVVLLTLMASFPAISRTYPKSGVEYDTHEGHSKKKVCDVAYSGAEHKIYQKIASNMAYEVMERECECEKAEEKVMGDDWYECEAEIRWRAAVK